MILVGASPLLLILGRTGSIMRALNKILGSFARKNEVEPSPVFPVPAAEDLSRNTVCFHLQLFLIFQLLSSGWARNLKKSVEKKRSDSKGKEKDDVDMEDDVEGYEDSERYSDVDEFDDEVYLDDNDDYNYDDADVCSCFCLPRLTSRMALTRLILVNKQN